MLVQLRSVTRTPILTGLPFGHVPTKVTLPVGARVQLVVQARDVLIGWWWLWSRFSKAPAVPCSRGAEPVKP